VYIKREPDFYFALGFQSNDVNADVMMFEGWRINK